MLYRIILCLCLALPSAAAAHVMPGALEITNNTVFVQNCRPGDRACRPGLGRSRSFLPNRNNPDVQRRTRTDCQRAYRQCNRAHVPGRRPFAQCMRRSSC
ncbi:MAG: hypothetical protein AAF318_02920 [Pseudomonadota bacterium]